MLDLFATLFSNRLPLFSVPRPERSSVGRGLLLPPSSRAQEGRGSLSQNDPLGSLVDLLAWVPRPDPACSGRSSKFRPGSQGAGSAPVRNSSRESRRAVADGMALVHGSRRLSVRLRYLLLSAGCAQGFHQVRLRSAVEALGSLGLSPQGLPWRFF